MRKKMMIAGLTIAMTALTACTRGMGGGLGGRW